MSVEAPFCVSVEPVVPSVTQTGLPNDECKVLDGGECQIAFQFISLVVLRQSPLKCPECLPDIFLGRYHESGKNQTRSTKDHKGLVRIHGELAGLQNLAITNDTTNAIVNALMA